MEAIANTTSEMEVWVRTNLEVITGALARGRDVAFCECQRREDSVRGLKYSSSRRVLSEMPLCTAMGNVPVPDGYEFCFGRVAYKDCGCGWSTMYCYFAHEDGLRVMCFTPGQFVMADEVLTPGDRLQRMKKRAPRLITMCSEQIAVLHGTREEIDRELDIKFLA